MPERNPVHRHSSPCGSWREGVRSVVAIAILLTSPQGALAGNPLRPQLGLPPGGSAAQPFGLPATSRTEPSPAEAAAAAARASAIAQDAAAPLRTALDTIRVHSGLQDAARLAAQAAAGTVPNGLATGGLKVLDGAAAGSADWLGAELPAEAASGERTEVTVVQKDPKAILTWSAFNVGKETDLYFDQRLGGAAAGSWAVLNRVADPAAAPSTILGSIRAEGQVYVLNRNGILFGGASQVNVGTLVASGLELAGADQAARNKRFLDGLLAASGLTFGGDPAVEGGAVTVEAGARLTVGAYGQALLLGRAVTNGGTITAPDGQVGLAAGRDAILLRPTDQIDHRIKILVQPGAVASAAVNTGVVSAPRGSISLQGSRVEQDGLATATTGAKASGSILLGNDEKDLAGLYTRGSTTISLGPGSTTQVLPDQGGAKVVGSTALGTLSSVALSGERIEVLGGATVYVPAGNLSLVATVASSQVGAADVTRVDVRDGARLDVSGLRGVEVAMEQNSLQGELRANELRDYPVLRDGPLRGQTVYFDARQAVEVADLTGYSGLVERSVEQLMTRAGTVSLVANEILARQGSVIDLSGGSLRYLDGYVRRSYLVDPSGRPVRIDLATPGVAYQSIDGGQVASHDRWGVRQTYVSPLGRTAATFEAGYTEGGAAGKLVLDTRTPAWYADNPNAVVPPDPAATGAIRILQGAVRASTVAGAHQRALPTGTADPTLAWLERPAGAVLEINRAGAVHLTDAPQAALDASFGSTSTFDAADPRRYQHELPAAWFADRTFAKVTIAGGYSDDADPRTSRTASRNLAPGGRLTVDPGVLLDLGDGGTFSYTGNGADVAGTIRAPGGTIAVGTFTLPQASSLDAAASTLLSPSIQLAATASLDVAGRLSNDHLDGGSPLRALGGGTVTLVSNAVSVAAGAVIDASGGARVDASGSKVTAGNGGSIALDVSATPGGVGSLALHGELRGYALGKGGSLSLLTNDEVVLGKALPAGAAAGARLLLPEFLTQGGFAQYAIAGSQGVTVAAGTELAPTSQTLVPTERMLSAPSGALVASLSTPTVLPVALQAPMSLSLSTLSKGSSQNGSTFRDLVIGAGTSITMPPGSSVKLTSNGTLEVGGAITALGGTIELATVNPGTAADVVQRIHLAGGALLDASGYQKSVPQGAMLRQSVVAGGTVTISANNEARLDPGSIMDVHGLAGFADLEAAAGQADGSPYARVQADGAAGGVAITVPKGTVAGVFKLAPGGATGAGGTLSILGTGGIAVRQDLAAAAAGPALAVSSASLAGTGADSLLLATMLDGATTTTAGDLIVLQEGVALEARRSLALRSSSLQAEARPQGSSGTGGDIRLAAGYVLLKGGTGVSATSLPEVTGSPVAKLEVKADLIDVRNSVWLGCTSGTCGGFSSVGLRSSGDIRLTDQGLPGFVTGLLTPAPLELEAAQVYVTSRQQQLGTGQVTLERAAADPGVLVRSGTSIKVIGTGGPSPVPLSAGERLTLRAPVIEQGGVLRAPQGQIRLEGSASVTLLEGSLTSTSLTSGAAGAVVPVGTVSTLGTFFGYDQAGMAPSKSVTISTPSAAVAQGAVIDVSGGGDLLGYRFAPGNQGSTDVLTTSGGFAVVPSLGQAPAPVGGVADLADGRLAVGDAIHLEGVPGLAAGVYTLLPAHYALLPGGLLIQPLGPASAEAPATFTRPDGAVVAAGYRTVAGQPIRDAGDQPFLVRSQQVFLQYADLQTTPFSRAASAVAAAAGVAVRTPADAGAVVIDAPALSLKGTGRFGAPGGALLGTLDLSAGRIAVAPASVQVAAGTLRLDPGDLTAFGAGSVLLGGRRTAGTGGTAVAVSASDVLVDTRGAAWSGPEIILAATGAVTVRDGSILTASGAPGGDASALRLTGDGVLLRLSTGGRVAAERSGATGTAGELVIGAAQLTAEGALSLDGSRSVAIDPAAVLTARQLGLSSSRLDLGDAPAATAGTILGTALLGRLAQAEDLLLRASDSIHLYGGLELGQRDAAHAASIASLTLDTGLVESHLAAGQSAHLTVGSLALRNGGAASAVAGAGGAGQLVLDVDSLLLGPGSVRLNGLASTQGSAGTVALRGDGALSAAGDLALATRQVRADPGVRYAIDAAGALALTSPGAEGALPPAGSLGSSLELSAAALRLDTALRLGSGTVRAAARTGALTLGPAAVVDVSGQAVDFAGQRRFAPGGTIDLAAATGLAVDPAAVLDVSAAAEGGPAGRIGITAGGQASVEGALRGSALAGQPGGSFSIDAAGLGAPGGVSALDALLAAGGLDEARAIRLRQQGIAVAAGERIQAHDVTLRSDTGLVAVAGTIAAGGTAGHPDGGLVQLIGGGGVALAGTASIDASAGRAAAGGFDPASGAVELVATGGRADLAPGATIDVSGGRSGGGSVVVRAPRQGNDVAIDRLGGQLRGARELVVQGVAVGDAAAGDAGLVANAMVTASSAWLEAGRAAMVERLAASGADRALLAIAPGMVVSSAGDLTVASDVSLGGRFGADAPGDLEFVAGGRLEVAAVVSDGFADATRGAALLQGRSSSLAFTSGGDVTLKAGALIRTGTGRLSLDAGGDLVLAAPASSLVAAPALYTAGRKTAAAAGFAGAAAGQPLGEFPVDGGAISLRAGRDLVLPFQSQTTSAWLFRSGSVTWDATRTVATVDAQTSWSVLPANFESGVGALGGGNVEVAAGRDLVNLQVALPTTGQLTSPSGQVAAAGDLAVRGGGDLTVRAGRDLLGGLLVLGRGHADVRVGGAIAAGTTPALLRSTEAGTSLASTRTVGVLLGLMDATATLTAGRDLLVEAAFDPMLQGQIAQNRTAGGAGTAFRSYSERAGLDAASLAGSVTYRNDPWASVDTSMVGPLAYQVPMVDSGDSLSRQFALAPPALRLDALGGDVALTSIFSTLVKVSPPKGTLRLAAAATGTLEALAKGDVRVALDVQLDDTSPNFRRGALTPFRTTRAAGADAVDLNGLAPATLRGATPIHAGDAEPARLTALTGMVCADLTGACVPRTSVIQRSSTTVMVPKPLEVSAGTDVLLGDYQPQNNGAAEVSFLQAGRDVFDAALELSGVGAGMVLAGRDVILQALGPSAAPAWGGAIYAKADNSNVAKPVTNGGVNPGLPHDRGADLLVAAGLANGVEYGAFAAAYLDPANSKGLVKSYSAELGDYLKGLGLGTVAEADRLSTFQALPEKVRATFVDRVLFAELKATGIDYNDAAGPRYHSYKRGFDALAALFPTDPATLAADRRGKVVLGAKPLETWADGEITVMAPYGAVEVGAPALPSTYAGTQVGGVVTRRGGDVHILADQNVDLYTSRVFTLQGGDITMWTSHGDVTAGSGSKTAVLNRPLTYTMSSDGLVLVDAFGLQTGSGIGVLDATQGELPRRSRLDLIAPEGKIDAGDAGIRVLGDINIAAQVVVGIENIQVSGASSGVPQVEAPNLGAVSAANQMAQTASQEGVGPTAAARAKPAADLPSIVTVEVVGYETSDDKAAEEREKKKRKAR